MISIDEERNWAERADKVIRMLSASSPNDETTMSTLRSAVDAATKPLMVQTFSSDGALNNARGEAGIALNGAMEGLSNRTLTSEKIDRARRAIEDWKSKLAAQ
jgi:hypothetical protein